MVQEVQTGIWITNETTLETIQAVGTSSVKIVEWRQTTWHFSSMGEASGEVWWAYDDSVPTGRDSPTKQGSMTISSNNGKMEFVVRDGGIRIPAAWAYSITANYKIGASNHSDDIYIKVGTSSSSPTIYSDHASTSTTVTKTFQVNLWKFDLITVWGHFYYSGSSNFASMKIQYSLTIQQL